MLDLEDKDINNYDEDNIESSDDFEDFYGIDNYNDRELNFNNEEEWRLNGE